MRLSEFKHPHTKLSERVKVFRDTCIPCEHFMFDKTPLRTVVCLNSFHTLFTLFANHIICTHVRQITSWQWCNYCGWDEIWLQIATLWQHHLLVLIGSSIIGYCTSQSMCAGRLGPACGNIVYGNFSLLCSEVKPSYNQSPSETWVVVLTVCFLLSQEAFIASQAQLNL